MLITLCPRLASTSAQIALHFPQREPRPSPCSSSFARVVGPTETGLKHVAFQKTKMDGLSSPLTQGHPVPSLESDFIASCFLLLTSHLWLSPDYGSSYSSLAPEISRTEGQGLSSLTLSSCPFSLSQRHEGLCWPSLGCEHLNEAICLLKLEIQVLKASFHMKTISNMESLQLVAHRREEGQGTSVLV